MAGAAIEPGCHVPVDKKTLLGARHRCLRGRMGQQAPDKNADRSKREETSHQSNLRITHTAKLSSHDVISVRSRIDLAP